MVMPAGRWPNDADDPGLVTMRHAVSLCREYLASIGTPDDADEVEVMPHLMGFVCGGATVANCLLTPNVGRIVKGEIEEEDIQATEVRNFEIQAAWLGLHQALATCGTPWPNDAAVRFVRLVRAGDAEALLALAEQSR